MGLSKEFRDVGFILGSATGPLHKQG